MKKILFFVFTLFLGFSVANAKTVGLTLDLDYNDPDVFNVFYEFKNNTPIAQLITKYSFDILDLFAENNENFVKGSSLAPDFNYENLSNNSNLYNVFIFKQDSQYQFLTIEAKSSRPFVCLLIFDENAKFVSSKMGVSTDILNNGSRDSILNIDNINSKYPYKLFSLYQGTGSLYTKNSYSLNYLVSDGVTYKLDGVDLGIFGSIGKFFTDFFKDKYSFGENWSFDFTYYNTHLVSSPNTQLKTLKESFFKFIDYDMSKYSYIYVNESENGAIFIPKVLGDNLDTSFYIYANHLNTPLYGNALYLSDDLSSDGYYYDIKTEDNTFGINLTNPCVVTELPLSSFNFDKGGTYSNYVYHIFTTKFTEDIMVYYDPDVYDVYILKNSNSSQTFTKPGTEQSYFYNGNTTISSKNNVDNTTGGHLSEDMSGKPGSSIGSSSNVSSIFTSYTPTSVLNSLSDIISTMNTFIAEFLGSFPSQISTPIYFFFMMSMAIAVVKLIF